MWGPGFLRQHPEEHLMLQLKEDHWRPVLRGCVLSQASVPASGPPWSQLLCPLHAPTMVTLHHRWSQVITDWHFWNQGPQETVPSSNSPSLLFVMVMEKLPSCFHPDNYHGLFYVVFFSIYFCMAGHESLRFQFYMFFKHVWGGDRRMLQPVWRSEDKLGVASLPPCGFQESRLDG